jgi:simple sugar transport system ATP-binding protein
MPEALRLDSVTKRFGGVEALRDVSFELQEGFVGCLVGENGSGKSTLIKIATGALRPDTGTITVAGHTYDRLSPREAISEGVDVIYQDLSLFPNLTVAENIALASHVREGRHVFDSRGSRKIAGSLLEQLGVPVSPDDLVANLGPAERQATAICRALSQDARLLFMDEPTASLTWREVERLFSIVRQVRARGVAVCFVSHKLDEVLDISDRVTVLRNGQVVADGPCAEFDRVTLAQAMTGRSGWAEQPPRPLGDAAPALEVRELSVPGVFEDVSLDVRRGEVVGVAGLLGSGAAELVGVVFGCPSASSGEIRVAGRRRSIQSPIDAMRVGIGYVPNDRLRDGLFIRHSIATNVASGNIPAVTGFGGLLRRRAMRAHGVRAIEALHIAARSPDALAGELSGGNQQKVVLARWLLRQPAILLLNGPTIGVDIGAKQEIHNLLADLSNQSMSIMIASDDVPELVATCHRIFVLRKGRLVAQMSGSDCTQEKLQAEMIA